MHACLLAHFLLLELFCSIQFRNPYPPKEWGYLQCTGSSHINQQSRQFPRDQPAVDNSAWRLYSQVIVNLQLKSTSTSCFQSLCLRVVVVSDKSWGAIDRWYGHSAIKKANGRVLLRSKNQANLQE